MSKMMLQIKSEYENDKVTDTMHIVKDLNINLLLHVYESFFFFLNFSLSLSAIVQLLPVLRAQLTDFIYSLCYECFK